MELKVSSPTDCTSDPEEKEISEDDDDDRNHKHRRRGEHSQSSEGDAPEYVYTRPYRKRNNPFENGHSFRDGGSQSGETWRNHNLASQGREFSGRMEKRRPNTASFSRTSFDSSQTGRVSHSISADQVPIRGRGRELGSWSQRDSRFGSVDIASQLVQQGSVRPNLFAGRGLPNVSSMQSTSWNVFGLVPAIPNGTLHPLHSIGLQGSLRPALNPSMSLGIPRQRCRDFEERGFCLRGDMCPMEHGVNRIVVEDVQSLSQFNLPVSLPNAHLLGTPAANASSSAFINSKGVHNKGSKLGMQDGGLVSNGAFISSSSVVGATDLYDPDQPLWTNDCPETSTALLALNASNIADTENSLERRPSVRHPFGPCDGSDNERLIKNVGSSKSRLEAREENGSALSSSSQLENEMKIDNKSANGAQGVDRPGRRINDFGTQVMGFSSKQEGDSGRIIRKPSQKALRTLFVNGIPQDENKRETLLSHFQKFGEVIDIYIPLNSERAFVQFAKREEAEAALKAPDAVMGNRFIKLLWANRDRIPVDGVSGLINVPANFRAATPLAPYPSSTKIKDNAQISGPKVNVAHTSSSSLPASDHPKPMLANVPKAPPPMQKKLENVALLKEFQKKQEMLAKKREEFMRQLDRLGKHSRNSKGEVPSDQPSNRHKVETVSDVKSEISGSNDSVPAVSPQQDESDSCRPAEKVITESSKSNSGVPLPDPSRLKPSICPLAPLGAPFVMNRFKLDNRPTAFKVLPPLPMGFANVSVLREYFSSYGDLNLVELEDFEHRDVCDESEASNISAHISFTTRHAAERAFSGAKCWQGQNLRFTWLASNTSKANAAKEIPSTAPKRSSDVINQSAGEVKTPAKEILSTATKRPSDVISQSVGEVKTPAKEIPSTATKRYSDVINQSAREVKTASFETTAASGTGESENLVRREMEMEIVDQDEDSKSSSSKASGGKRSP